MIALQLELLLLPLLPLLPLFLLLLLLLLEILKALHLLLLLQGLKLTWPYSTLSALVADYELMEPNEPYDAGDWNAFLLIAVRVT